MRINKRNRLKYQISPIKGITWTPEETDNIVEFFLKKFNNIFGDIYGNDLIGFGRTFNALRYSEGIIIPEFNVHLSNTWAPNPRSYPFPIVNNKLYLFGTHNGPPSPILDARNDIFEIDLITKNYRKVMTMNTHNNEGGNHNRRNSFHVSGTKIFIFKPGNYFEILDTTTDTYTEHEYSVLPANWSTSVSPKFFIRDSNNILLQSSGVSNTECILLNTDTLSQTVVDINVNIFNALIDGNKAYNIVDRRLQIVNLQDFSIEYNESDEQMSIPPSGSLLPFAILKNKMLYLYTNTTGTWAVNGCYDLLTKTNTPLPNIALALFGSSPYAVADHLIGITQTDTEIRLKRFNINTLSFDSDFVIEQKEPHLLWANDTLSWVYKDHLNNLKYLIVPNDRFGHASGKRINFVDYDIQIEFS